jgi:Na+-translocating ferredoxin:NAD+ oxidoreductase RnfG subunit
MIFLTPTQMKDAEKLSGVPVGTALIARYVAYKDGRPVGRAYLDTHIVRTKKESILILLNENGSVRRVEVVAFQEPPEYLPSERWYQQFEGKSLNADLQMKKSIHPVTGATLTAQATTDAVRKVLAIDQILADQKAVEGKKQ